MGRYPYFSPEHLSLFRMRLLQANPSRLSCSSTFPDHYTVEIDPQAFKQGLIKFTEQCSQIYHRGGSKKLRPPLVHIDDNHAVIKMTIMDSGSGLSQEEQQQLFKRYSQTSAGRQQTGSGLGLMICKELIKKYAGRFVIRKSSRA